MQGTASKRVRFADFTMTCQRTDVSPVQHRSAHSSSPLQIAGLCEPAPVCAAHCSVQAGLQDLPGSQPHPPESHPAAPAVQLPATRTQPARSAAQRHRECVRLSLSPVQAAHAAPLCLDSSAEHHPALLCAGRAQPWCLSITQPAANVLEAAARQPEPGCGVTHRLNSLQPAEQQSDGPHGDTSPLERVSMQLLRDALQVPSAAAAFACGAGGVAASQPSCTSAARAPMDDAPPIACACERDCESPAARASVAAGLHAGSPAVQAVPADAPLLQARLHRISAIEPIAAPISRSAHGAAVLAEERLQRDRIAALPVSCARLMAPAGPARHDAEARERCQGGSVGCHPLCSPPPSICSREREAPRGSSDAGGVRALAAALHRAARATLESPSTPTTVQATERNTRLQAASPVGFQPLNMSGTASRKSEGSEGDVQPALCAQSRHASPDGSLCNSSPIATTQPAALQHADAGPARRTLRDPPQSRTSSASNSCNRCMLAFTQPCQPDRLSPSTDATESSKAVCNMAAANVAATQQDTSGVAAQSDAVADSSPALMQIASQPCVAELQRRGDKDAAAAGTLPRCGSAMHAHPIQSRDWRSGSDQLALVRSSAPRAGIRQRSACLCLQALVCLRAATCRSARHQICKQLRCRCALRIVRGAPPLPRSTLLTANTLGTNLAHISNGAARHRSRHALAALQSCASLGRLVRTGLNSNV